MKISLIVKNYKFPTSLIILFSALIYAGYYFSSIQEDDGLRINLSGRQRMLSQRITKEILLYKIGEISSDRIMKSLKIFTETQDALSKGGQAPLDLKSENYRFLPGTSHKASLEKLLEIRNEWEPIEKNIIDYIRIRDEVSLKYIIAHNETLLKKIDDSVYALQLMSEKNSLIIRIIIICSFIMISTLLIINFKKRIKELRNAAERIKELENLLPMCSNCKKIRVDNDKPMEPESWTTIEEYLHVNKDMLFTHSICPDCIKKLYPGLIGEIKNNAAANKP